MSSFAELSQRSTFPYNLLAIILLIGGLGVANIYSAGHAKSAAEIETSTNSKETIERRKAEDKWKKQIIWLVAGLIAAISLLRFDYRMLERISYPLYGVLIVFLLLVLAIGKAKLGAKRWIELPGGVNFQPSEAMKISIILVLARYFAAGAQQERAFTIRDLLRPLNVSRPVIALVALLFLWGTNVWLQDPIGELSRKLAGGYNFMPPEWDGTYMFRALIITGLLIYGGFAGLAWTSSEREKKAGFQQQAPSRTGMRAVLLFGPLFIVAASVWIFWQSEFLGDPKNVVITWLVQAGSPGGRHVVFAPVLWFRVLLLVAAIGYLAYSIFSKIEKGGTELRDWLAPIDLVLLPMGLIMKQPDLGTALLVGSISFSIILFIGMRWTSVVLLTVSGVALSVISWFTVLKDYQKRRMLTFLDPEWDAKGAGYHAIQSTIAVGSGGWNGKGFMRGTQSTLEFLPEPHTDFAFAVWGEEHGFLGCLVLISLYFLLIVLAVGIAARARDKFGALLVTGFTALIFWQAFVNMGMVSGILPVVGVPLPIFSYGGSSLFSVMLGLGIALNVAYRRNTFS